jgi:hypothetical protein
MPKQRKTYGADLKARIALEAIKGQRTLNEIASPRLYPFWTVNEGHGKL